MRISDWSSDVCSSDLLAVLDRKRKLTFDERQRVAAELLEPPAFEDRQPVALARRQGFEIVAACQQLGRDIDLARTDFEQELQQVGDQRAFLAEPDRKSVV